MLKLGSLFDGSGGFPLAGVLHGVEPVWASEIEPYPVRVTTARFPAMKHLGDVTRINGAEIEPVDIITFGSPCQDLSVAGKQAGLHKGERSNLFFEAIRIIKEMRESTDGIYPRIAIWENVPGAFSSNKGADFQAVLQAFCEVKDPAARVPMPPKNKWGKSGAIVGDGWSVAWRTLDAQFWGVPQRRRRIYLIADFGSERAGEILFEQESSYRDSAESGAQRESPSANAQGSPGRGCKCLTPDDVQSRRVYTEDGIWPSLYGGEGGGHGYVLRQGAAGDAEGSVGGSSVWAIDHVITTGGNCTAQGPCVYENIAPTEKAAGVHAVCYPIDLIRESRGAFETYEQDADKAGSLKQCDNKGSQVVCYQNKVGALCMDDYKGINQQHVSQDKVVCYALQGNGIDRLNAFDAVIQPGRKQRKYIIRRLTPLECCRLQGFPDDWCSGLGTENPTEDEIAFWAEVWETHRRIMGRSGKAKSRKQIIKWLKDPHSDSAEYKMWGNGIALPNAAHVVGCAVKLIKEERYEHVTDYHARDYPERGEGPHRQKLYHLHQVPGCHVAQKHTWKESCVQKLWMGGQTEMTDKRYPTRMEEIRERAEKAIMELVSLLPEQISYAEYVGANSCYGSGPYIWTDPEPYVMDEAAKLIKELLAEVARLTDERDAAVRDMRRDSHCLQCKKHRSVGGDCLGFSMCGQDRPSWQWRGPCAENRRKEE